MENENEVSALGTSGISHHTCTSISSWGRVLLVQPFVAASRLPQKGALVVYFSVICVLFGQIMEKPPIIQRLMMQSQFWNRLEDILLRGSDFVLQCQNNNYGFIDENKYIGKCSKSIQFIGFVVHLLFEILWSQFHTVLRDHRRDCTKGPRDE